MPTNPKEYMREYQRRRRAKLKAEKESSSLPSRPQPTPIKKGDYRGTIIPVKREAEPRIATVHPGHLRIEQPLQPEPQRESVKPETLKFLEFLYNQITGKKKKPEKQYVEPKI